MIREFLYPRRGPGQLWEAVRDQVQACGNRVELNKTVVRIRHREGRVLAVETQDGAVVAGDHFYATMPLRELVNALDPPPPKEILAAGNSLRYRDFMTVAVVVDQAELFPDNWIYIHDPDVRVGRIQNYKNWSRDMVADPSQTCLGLEYFCNRGDGFWEMPDADLLRLAFRELEQIGLAQSSRCVDGCVVRIPNAYPVYDRDYQQHRDTVRDWLGRSLENLHPAGRGGLHNYNSQDHSMMAALLSVRNVQFGDVHDVWSINTDAEYAEENANRNEIDERLVPRPLGMQGALARNKLGARSSSAESSR